MENMMDYLRWRGDLTFGQDPFNEVDNQLCSCFAYLELEEIFDPVQGGELALSLACKLYFDRLLGREKHLGALIPPVVFDLAEQMASAPRFEKTRITAVREVVKDDQSAPDGQVQWSAMTYLFEDHTMYIAFRGTDDSLIGWKEDFNMAVFSTVPSQREAAAYVREVLLAYPDYQARIGGHSKGGNLAVYSAAKCGQDVQDRILAVYANDAPGFPRSFLADPDYQRIRKRVLLILPDQSFVGLLLYHDAPRRVVKSCEKSIRQHDFFTWQVERNRFERAQGISGEALLLRKAVLAWMDDMTVEERQAFIETVYRMLTTEACTVTELVENRATLLRSYRKLEPEQRQVIRGMLKKLFSNGKEVYGEVLHGQKKETPPPVRKRRSGQVFVTHFNGESLKGKAKKKKS
ncbi:MAG: DUF2974 domain-containing protein [Clostridia bacterium]|nr:DUF2974 domain-containing protein [Clostridia bacterium]